MLQVCFSVGINRDGAACMGDIESGVRVAIILFFPIVLFDTFE